MCPNDFSIICKCLMFQIIDSHFNFTRRSLTKTHFHESVVGLFDENLVCVLTEKIISSPSGIYVVSNFATSFSRHSISLTKVF